MGIVIGYKRQEQPARPELVDDNGGIGSSGFMHARNRIVNLGCVKPVQAQNLLGGIERPRGVRKNCKPACGMNCVDDLLRVGCVVIPDDLRLSLSADGEDMEHAALARVARKIIFRTRQNRHPLVDPAFAEPPMVGERHGVVALVAINPQGGCGRVRPIRPRCMHMQVDLLSPVSKQIRLHSFHPLSQISLYFIINPLFLQAFLRNF